MDYKKITAIIRNDRLECVEQNLKKRGVKGITVSRVKGYGEYTNFFSRDWLSDQTKIEIYTAAGNANHIARRIIECAHTGSPGDGIVVVEPADSVYRVRTRALAEADEF